MGLIYVNPEGPNGKPDPIAAARDIRETFGRMAMNDEETVALIAGGHTLGKAHGATTPKGNVGPEPEGLASKSKVSAGRTSTARAKAGDTITSGLEGAWTSTPTQWSNGYFKNMFRYEWELTKSPAGAYQWTPKDSSAKGTVPDAFDDEAKTHAPIMFTTDMALKMDPSLRQDLEAVPRQPQGVQPRLRQGLVQADPPRHGTGFPVPRPARGRAAALAGPRSRRWITRWSNAKDIAGLKAQDPGFGPDRSRNWSRPPGRRPRRIRGSDKRGGANGARLRLAPQKDWEVNNPAQLAKVMPIYEKIQKDFNKPRRVAARRFRLRT